MRFNRIIVIAAFFIFACGENKPDVKPTVSKGCAYTNSPSLRVLLVAGFDPSKHLCGATVTAEKEHQTYTLKQEYDLEKPCDFSLSAGIGEFRITAEASGGFSPAITKVTVQSRIVDSIDCGPETKSITLEMAPGPICSSRQKMMPLCIFSDPPTSPVTPTW